ncbi:MAG: 6-phosphofructokinase [Verrucomicrobia bacterium]|nr:6-phosphofructokinase [Verrucomicrobiota bacterium]
MLSPLAKKRLTYEPPIPKILKDLSKVTFRHEHAMAPHADIAALFPQTISGEVASAEVTETQKLGPLKIGVVFSGGPASGGHNVIAGLFDALQKLANGSTLIGFQDGPQGIIDGEFVVITAKLLENYRNQGGFDLLGSGRVKIETDVQLQSSMAQMKKIGLDGLVIIGGDDSNTNAAVLAEYFAKHECKTRVIGVPKTIDGDLQNPYVEISFGFDTATKTYSELIGNIARDALSSKKYYHFIRLMGRTASHIALECALSTHPNLVLISEEKKSLSAITKEIVDLVKERAAEGKHYGVILVPEGLIESMPDINLNMSDDIARHLGVERDAHGNVNVSAIETEKFLIYNVKKELGEKFAALSHFFGYEGRCGLPTNFDANYCYVLGMAAALLVARGETSKMAFVGHLSHPPEKWTVGGVSLTALMHLEERKGKRIPVIAKALVDLHGKAYREMQAQRAQWRLHDDYLSPGPIQFV